MAGEPLSPALLERIGGIQPFPPAGGDGRVRSFRIFTCHGNVDEGNLAVGLLRIQREDGERPGELGLTVDQRILNGEGTLHSQRARARCRGDAIASLMDWDLSSRFFGGDGEPAAGLTAEESGRVEGGTIEFRKGSSAVRRSVSGSLTSDWSLFTAIERLAFESPRLPAFDVLEGLSLLRPGHRLVYRGLYHWSGGGVDGPLRWFQQTGHGTLPYEYWLDGGHRLLVASTLARAYVLDDRAEEALRARQEEVQRRVRARRARKNA